MNADAGTYVLVMENGRDRHIDVGRLGRATFPTGFYLYVGSAFGPGGVRARVGRHFRKHKKVHWHIDNLTRTFSVLECWYHYGRDRLECEWNRLLADSHDRFPVRGFGATDCACSSHLHFFGHRPGSDQVAGLHRTLSGIARKRGK